MPSRKLDTVNTDRPAEWTADPEAFCACGHHENQHTRRSTRCAAVEPDICTCRGFRYGSRSEYRRRH
jgi:hypothetical protein